MKRTLFYPVFILFALVSGACADSTLPEPGSAAPGMIAAHGAGPSQSYMLEPVIVVGKCDPYLSLDWCGGGGSCATSVDGGGDGYTVQGCGEPYPGGGGGGGYTGGGGGGGAGGSTGGTAGTAAAKDASGCPGCGERAPTAQEKSDMEAQLSKVTCTDVRNALSSMLTAGTLLVYTDDDGRYAGWDSRSGTIFVSKGKHWLSTGLDQDELADSMAHEGVHKILGHVYGQPDTETHGQDFNDKMAACGFPQA
jgi:hypothetical protein